jgi:protein-disulfide isomerase
MIEFSEFECPACGRFAREVIPVIQGEYIDSGKVLLAFWHRPLDRHKRAVPAAIAANCAGAQGKFWPLHDLLRRRL